MANRSWPTPRALRPNMPPGYGISNDSDGLMNWEAVCVLLEKARNYWVSTVSPQGRPHAMPVWGLWLDGAFLFGTDPISRKARNLESNPDVVVHLESGDEAVILEGRAVRVRDGTLLARFADAYEAKYTFRPETHDGAFILEVRPQTAFAWLERDFPNTATRWQFH